MEELLHSIHWFEFELEIVRAAIALAQKCRITEVSVGIAYFTTTDKNGKRCVVPESDLIIIANGLVLLEDTPEYAPVVALTAKHNAFRYVCTRVAQHLGREFIR